MATVQQALWPETAQYPSASFAAFRLFQGTGFPVSVLAYDAAASEHAWWKVAPFGFVATLSLRIYWYADSASSGVVRWEAALAAITADTDAVDVETKATATAQQVDDTHLGTVAQRLHVATLAITNLDALAAGDAAWLRITRLGAHANDTLANDALLERAYLSWSDV